MLCSTHSLASVRSFEDPNRGGGEPRMPLFAWFASPAPLAIGMAHGGIVAVVSITVGMAVPALVAIATYRPRYSHAPPLCLALLFVAAVGALRFNSAAFVIDAWTTLLMALATIPRSRATVARGPAATDAEGGREDATPIGQRAVAHQVQVPPNRLEARDEW
jgi:hypothetical protein